MPLSYSIRRLTHVLMALFAFGRAKNTRHSRFRAHSGRRE